MRYIVARQADEFLVIDLPRKGVAKRGTVIATCTSDTLAEKVRTALEDRFPAPEEIVE